MENKSLKWSWKNIILSGLPIIIAILSIFCGILYGRAKEWFGVCITVTLILGISNIVAVFYYEKKELATKNKEAELKQEIEKLKKTTDEEKQNSEKVYRSIQRKSEILGYIVATFKETINGYTVNINNISNDIIDRGVAEKRDWNVAQLCDTVCKSCCELVKKIAEEENSISVGYISAYNKNGTQYINMIAHSDITKPNVYKMEQLLEDCNYYYASIIKTSNPQIRAFATKEEILKHFRARNCDTDLSKYSQYIALPVMCDANKIIGVLQIVVKNDLKIRNTEKELIGLAEAYITPYVSLLVLINKLDKGLFAIPNRKEG